MKASVTFFAFAAAAGFASAQSLSDSCNNALQTVVASPQAQCLNAPALLSFFIGTDKSVPDTVNNWLSGLCSVGFCSNDTLAAVVANITQGCSTDLSSAGVPVSADQLTQIVQQVYPTVRSIVCLQDNDSKKLCVTEELSNIESAIGKLSLDNLSIATLTQDFTKLVATASNIACSKCTKAAFSLASQLTSQFPQALTAINSLCGSGFISGTPSDMDGVSQTANNEAFTTKKSSAVSVQTTKMAGAVMLFFFAAFTLLG